MNYVVDLRRGGNFPSQWVFDQNDKGINMPGTFLEIKLCPFKEVTKFNFTFNINNIEKEWKLLQYEVTKRDVNLFRSWISDRNEFQEANTIVILRKRVSSSDFKHFLEEGLKNLSFVSHPNGIVVYVADDNELGYDTLEGIVDSANQLLLQEVDNQPEEESLKAENDYIYDPVVVIGQRNNISWFGGNQNLINILNDIYEHPYISSIKHIDSYNKLDTNDKIKVRLHFNNNNPLIIVDNDGIITLNFSNVLELFKIKIASFLNSQESLKKTSGKICSPKLKVIDKWYDIKSLLKDSDLLEYAFAIYLKFKETFPDYKFNSNTHILIDHSMQYDLAIEFAKFTGIDKRNIISIINDIDYRVPRRSSLFNREDEVIILTTIISSEESIRRAVKCVKRDLAKPICITCLIDNRDKVSEEFMTWGAPVNIVSLYSVVLPKKASNIHDFPVDLCQNFISPSFEIEKEWKNKECMPEKLEKYLIENKIIHYSHIGSINGRHFTFYLDKKKVLESHSFIWDDFLDKLIRWKENKNKIKICFIEPLFNKECNEIWRNFIGYILPHLNLSENDVLKWVIEKPIILDRYENIVLIDFGMLTGNTINTFLEYVKYAKNIFICILFSQFQNSGLEFYKRLNTINVYKKKETILFENDDWEEIASGGSHLKDKELTANVKVEFLYNLPIDYYSSSTCPICEHERALETYKMHDDYMISFTNDRKKRLRIKDKNSIPPVPYDFYYNSSINIGDDSASELSSILIMKMYKLKILLENALIYTQARVVLYKYIKEIQDAIDEQIQDCNSELYALLYFTSHEVNWFQREPLVFKDIRKIISNISLVIATTQLFVLKKYFIQNNFSEKASLKLGVRFKYSAITVLRSSDKFLFCKNIASLLLSSIDDESNHLSNNLVQNTIYHINSLLINQYNKSPVYFENIRMGLKEVIDSWDDHKLTISQVSALRKIDVLARRNQRMNELVDKKTDVQLIISLKKEIDEHYNGVRHPAPIEHLAEIDFSQLEEFLPDLQKDGKDSVFYENFESIQKGLIKNWGIVSNFLESVVHTHLDKLSEAIFESKLFRSFHIQEHMVLPYQEKPLIGQSDKFSELVYQISKSLDCLIINYNDYKKLWNDINIHFIREEGKRNEKSDSTLRKLLSDFPADIIVTIKNIFPKSDFYSVLITPSEGSYLAFYPSSQLSIHLALIKKIFMIK